MKMPIAVSTALSFIIFTVLPTASASFTDVTPSHPYADGINYVQTQGIVSGYSDGTYQPEKEMNRAEFSKILANAAYNSQASGNNCFPDVTDQWFAPFICTLKSKGAVSGYPDGTFKPEQPIRFSELAKMVSSAYDYKLFGGGDWYEPPVRALSLRGSIPPSIADLQKFVNRGEFAEMVYRLQNDLRYLEQVEYDDDRKFLYKTTPQVLTADLNLTNTLKNEYEKLYSVLQTKDQTKIKTYMLNHTASASDEEKSKWKKGYSQEEWALISIFLEEYSKLDAMTFVDGKRYKDWAVLYYDDPTGGLMSQGADQATVTAIFFRFEEGSWRMNGGVKTNTFFKDSEAQPSFSAILNEIKNEEDLWLPPLRSNYIQTYEDLSAEEQVMQDFNFSELFPDKTIKYFAHLFISQSEGSDFYFIAEGVQTTLFVRMRFQNDTDGHWAYTGDMESQSVPTPEKLEDMYIQMSEFFNDKANLNY